jgi:hypothetical protein
MVLPCVLSFYTERARKPRVFKSGMNGSSFWWRDGGTISIHKSTVSLHMLSFLLYCFYRSFVHKHGNPVCRFHGKPFPWVKAGTFLSFAVPFET